MGGKAQPLFREGNMNKIKTVTLKQALKGNITHSVFGHNHLPITNMKMNYQVISSNEDVVIKFFYQTGKKYGEFYIYMNREAKSASNPESPIGIHGRAELQMKDPEYAKDLLQALAVALKGEK